MYSLVLLFKCEISKNGHQISYSFDRLLLKSVLDYNEWRSCGGYRFLDEG